MLSQRSIERITYDDLDELEDLKMLADVIGIENLRKCLQHLSGSEFYIPNRLWKQARDRIVREEIERGSSPVQIAQVLGISVKYVTSVIQQAQV